MLRLLATALAALMAVTSSTPAADTPSWKAGAAATVITPKALMWMSGYASRTKPAEGKIHDLYAKALALEGPGGNRAVLVTLDLVGIPGDLSADVCGDLERKLGLPRKAVALATSHTHTGPVVQGNLMSMYFLDADHTRLVVEYRKELRRLIVEVVEKAVSRLAPAQLAWDVGTTDFAVNRRNNPEKDVPQLRTENKLKGPVDHDVPVLTARDAGGKLLAVVFGYACHATVLGLNQWSGDYPGFAQIELEKAHPGAVAMFWAGCGGDQNPLPRRTVALAEKYGKQLAASVEAVLKRTMKPIQGGLHTAFTETPLPFAALPTREQLVQDSMSTNRYIAARARYLLEKLASEELPGHYPYPIQAWRLGEGPTWVFLGGEVVVDYSLRLKKELGPDTWVAGYCNDVMAYIPSLRVLREGGYEGASSMIYYGQPTVWGPQVEEVLIASAHKQVEKVRGK